MSRRGDVWYVQVGMEMCKCEDMCVSTHDACSVRA